MGQLRVLLDRLAAREPPPVRERPAVREDRPLPGWADDGAWRGQWPAPADVVAGESHYQDALRAIAGAPRPGGWLVAVDVELVRERDNPYDANAVRVEIDGAKIGYLARSVAAIAAPELDRLGRERWGVPGIVRGGSDHAPTLGVHLFLRAPGFEEAPGLPSTIADDHVVAWPPSPSEGQGGAVRAPGPRPAPG